MKTPIFRSIGLAGILGIGLFAGPGDPVARARAPTTIDFVVVSGATVTPPSGEDAGDILIFTGPAKFFATSAGTCSAAPGPYPVQNAVVVDQGGGPRSGATRLIDVIVVAESDSTPGAPLPPVKPGTKLVNLQTLPGCQNTDASIGYDRYRGTVQ
jgi:hypothetical protein